MPEPVYDVKSQYDQVKAGLQAGEEIDAVFDCKGGHWFRRHHEQAPDLPGQAVSPTSQGDRVGAL